MRQSSDDLLTSLEIFLDLMTSSSSISSSRKNLRLVVYIYFLLMSNKNIKKKSSKFIDLRNFFNTIMAPISLPKLFVNDIHLFLDDGLSNVWKNRKLRIGKCYRK